jgi:hypothetical protein
MKQLITINTKGEVATLEFKNGVDVKQLGSATVRRVTDILWNDLKGVWVIECKQGYAKGEVVSTQFLEKNGLLSNGTGISAALDCYPFYRESRYVGFNSYAEAVSFEVRLIQTARRLGKEGLFIDGDLL